MNRKDINTARWLSVNEYSQTWQERNDRLLQLLIDCVSNTNNLTYTEYGCGPYAPFTAICREMLGCGIRADIKQWDEDIVLCDLNTMSCQPLKTNIGVLSGVVEYLTDPRTVFDSLRGCHERLLISYAPFNNKITLTDRILKNGWRNHYSLYDFVQIVNHFGYIENIGDWRGQMLLLLRSKNIL